MAAKKRAARGRARKAGKKPKPAKHVRTRRPLKKAKAEAKSTTVDTSKISQEPFRVEPPARERRSITVENIRGDTVVGDLLVTFPRTREVLVTNGLKLEAEDAGDIYMTLDAFSAMNGLKTERLVEELVEAAKESSPQQSVAQLVAPPSV
jgi:hypothetical protein